jgi:class 3 adenylate cyclase
MNCAACGHANPEGAAFCNACGQRLGGGRSPRAYAPEHLVEKIRAGQRRLAGEHKQVTVLFADVTGSMALAESVAAEAWQRIMDRFFALLCGGVHRFEGTVNTFTGDGIMALFGAPIAHEDHARRACYAALYLRDELARYAAELRRERGLNFSVRMGLNSGEVVVGPIGDDLRLDYTAIGHTVGLAERIESLAEPGQVYLTEHTARLVDGFFALRDLGAFELRGVSEPARVFRLEGTGPLRTRLDVAGARGFSRFVGRRDELAVLAAALDAALAGEGAVVGISGEAGVGKSRLCHELVERCRARGIAVFEGHGVSYAKRIALLPILELIRGVFGITEHDSDQATREKIAGRLLLLDDVFRDDLPLVFDFLGVRDRERPPPRMDPEARQRQLLAIGRRMIQARARREPAVHLYEDLHWFDAVSEAFLENNVEAVSGTRTLVLATFRPGYQPRWIGTHDVRQIALAPLGEQAADELLRDLLGTDPSLDGLADRIRERTGGNPFFIEEVVRALGEEGALVGERGLYRPGRQIDEIKIPATVRAVLEARIDRLADTEKAVLQTASVIGPEFSDTVLRRLVDGEDGLSEALAGIGRRRADLRAGALPGRRVCLQASAHPGGRLHLAALRASGADARSRRRRPQRARRRSRRGAGGAAGPPLGTRTRTGTGRGRLPAGRRVGGRGAPAGGDPPLAQGARPARRPTRNDRDRRAYARGLHSRAQPRLADRAARGGNRVGPRGRPRARRAHRQHRRAGAAARHRRLRA